MTPQNHAPRHREPVPDEMVERRDKKLAAAGGPLRPHGKRCGGLCCLTMSGSLRVVTSA